MPDLKSLILYDVMLTLSITFSLTGGRPLVENSWTESSTCKVLSPLSVSRENDALRPPGQYGQNSGEAGLGI